MIKQILEWCKQTGKTTESYHKILGDAAPKFVDVKDLEKFIESITPKATWTNFMPPDERTIIPPPGGWEERSFYEVNIAYGANNPVHKAIFYSGFLNGKSGERTHPGGYNKIFSPTGDAGNEIKDVFFMEAIRNLGVEKT